MPVDQLLATYAPMPTCFCCRPIPAYVEHKCCPTCNMKEGDYDRLLSEYVDLIHRVMDIQDARVEALMDRVDGTVERVSVLEDLTR